MSNATIYIGNEAADLSDDTIIALTRSAHNLTDLESRNGDKTNRFTFPDTAKNRELFGFANVVNATSNIPRTRIDMLYYADGIAPNKGYFVLEAYTKGKGFESNFYSGNADLFNLIGNKKLNDLDLSAYDVYWNLDANTPNVFDVKANTSGTTFPIIEYSKDNDYPALPLALNNSDGLRHVDPKYLRPAVYNSTILAEILSSVGYTLIGDFANNAEYLAEATVITTNNPKHTEAYNINQQFLVENSSIITINVPPGITISTDITFDTVISDPSFRFGDPYYYVTSDGKYTFVFRYKITSPDFGTNTTSYTASIFKLGPNGSRITLAEVNVESSMVLFSNLIAENVDCLSGDLVYINVTSSVGDLDAPSVAYVAADVRFSCTSILGAKINYGNLFEITGNLPEIGQKDFIKSLCQRYNLIPITNAYAQTLELFPYKEYYNNITAALDWTDKLHTAQQSIGFHPNYGQSNKLMYVEDDDLPKDFASDVIVVQDETIDIENIIKQPYGASLMVKRLAELDCPFIPLIEFDTESADLAYRYAQAKTIILNQNAFVGTNGKNALLKGLGSAPIVTFKTETVTNRIIYIEPQAVSPAIKYDDGTATATDTGNEPIATFNGLDFTTLITNHYTELQFSLQNYKTVTRKFKLTAADVVGYDFKRPVYFDGCYWYVNKIDGFIPGRLTNVELMRM